jgi:hypothetical protein
MLDISNAQHVMADFCDEKHDPFAVGDDPARAKDAVRNGTTRVENT